MKAIDLIIILIPNTSVKIIGMYAACDQSILLSLARGMYHAERTHACMHTCPHACMHTCTHACMHTCTHACMHKRTHACMHTFNYNAMYNVSLMCIYIIVYNIMNANVHCTTMACIVIMVI